LKWRGSSGDLDQALLDISERLIDIYRGFLDISERLIDIYRWPAPQKLTQAL